MLFTIIKIVLGLGFLFIVAIAFANDHINETQKRKESKDDLQAFETQYKLTAGIPYDYPAQDVREKYRRAKGLIIGSTSEFCSDCPGEAKSLLRDAIFIVKELDEFGHNLATLIDIAIGHSYSCRDCNESSLHKMLWDCARLITMRFGDKETKKKKKTKKTKKRG